MFRLSLCYAWLCIVLLQSSMGHAQSAPTVVAEQELMQQATLIFEGELVRTASYFNADSTRQFYTSLVRITRLLKGHSDADTVQVVYPGIRISAVIRDPQTGETMLAMTMPPSHGPSDVGGSVPLPAGKPVVLFCRSLPSRFAPRPPRLTTARLPVLERVGGAWDLFREGSIVSDVGGRFADFPALYRYLSEHYHLGIR
ncbi:hypothetical protein [Hymenobacter algoricola]|uniref:hypothetical protein n=1 Tax=Hymenobacter algoricola TaxID=486267 RepID=UPI0031EE74E9